MLTEIPLPVRGKAVAMRNQVPIRVEERNDLGKNASRRLRAEGMIPAVVYGAQQEPIGVQVDPRPLEAVISSDRGLNTLIQLAVEGQEILAMAITTPQAILTIPIYNQVIGNLATSTTLPPPAIRSLPPPIVVGERESPPAGPPIAGPYPDLQ